MRHVLAIAAAAALALSSPTFAQQDVTQEQFDAAVAAVEVFELSDEAYKNMWCGAAFHMIADMMRAQGATADADTMTASEEAVFAKAAVELIEAGVSQEDFSALAEHITVVATGQTNPEIGEADFTQEDCMAAAAP